MNGANGGAGAAASLTNAVSGSTNGGSLELEETANGGGGGGVMPLPSITAARAEPSAPRALPRASLTFNDNQSVTQSVTVTSVIRPTAGTAATQVWRRVRRGRCEGHCDL